MPDPISMLYDAAIGEEEWQRAVEAVGDDIGAGIILLGVGDPHRPEELEMWVTGGDMTPLSAAGYSLGDVWDPDINPGVAAGMVMPVGRSMHVREIVPDDVFAGSHFLQSTMGALGVTNHRLYVPLREPNMLAGGYMAKAPHKDFAADDVPCLDDVVPHLGRALRLRAQLDRHRSTVRTLGGLLEELAYGVMLLDRNGEIVLMNARCEAFRTRADGIAVLRRRPDLGPAANGAVAAALDVVDLGRGSFPSATGVPIPRSSGLPPYLARIYPGIGFASLAGAGGVRVAVLIDDPLDPAVLPDTALLSAMFGLTPAEAAVARLVPSHLARRAMAEQLGLSENTVKTHLATIRDKLGARTTAEMVRILTRATLAPPR
jgi:DNA-binding CsgD family transcriptional regulator/PAS domain-containing protein